MPPRRTEVGVRERRNAWLLSTTPTTSILALWLETSREPGPRIRPAPGRPGSVESGRKLTRRGSHRGRSSLRKIPCLASVAMSRVVTSTPSSAGERALIPVARSRTRWRRNFGIGCVAPTNQASRTASSLSTSSVLARTYGRGRFIIIPATAHPRQRRLGGGQCSVQVPSWSLSDCGNDAPLHFAKARSCSRSNEEPDRTGHLMRTGVGRGHLGLRRVRGWPFAAVPDPEPPAAGAVGYRMSHPRAPLSRQGCPCG